VDIVERNALDLGALLPLGDGVQRGGGNLHRSAAQQRSTSAPVTEVALFCCRL
jgi:hypothetical protein